MRIAHVTATFPPYYGGTGNVCYHNTRVLAELGHDVHVFSADSPGERDDPPGVTVNRLKPLMQVGNAPVLPQLLRLNRFDLIHLHYPFYTGAEFVSLARVPYVVTYHQDVEFDGLLGLGTRLHGRMIGNAVLRRAARICPTSLDYFAHSDHAELLSSRNDAIVEMPNGVDLQRFRPGPVDRRARERFNIPRDAFLALFVGAQDRAHYFKGIPTLLRAMINVPQIHLLLVGDGELRSEFEQLAENLGVARQVAFAGHVDSDDLPAIYRSADLLVLPSETRGEAFGMVLLEAMASGRPVIASDLPGVRAVVADGVDGYLTVAGDADSLATMLAMVTQTPLASRLAMGAAGRRKVETHYGWEQIGGRLEAIYSDVLESRVLLHAS